MFRHWGLFRLTAALIASATLVAGLGLFATRAIAQLYVLPETGVQGLLWLSSDQTEVHNVNISPGSPDYWQISAGMDGADEGTLELRMQKSGTLVEHKRGLTVTVDRCDNHWTNVPAAPACGTGATRVMAATPADNYNDLSPAFDLGGIQTLTGKHLLVTLAIEDSAEAAADTTLMGQGYQIAFQLVAGGDVPAVPGGTATPAPDGDSVAGSAAGGTLALTGIDAAALGLIAAGAIGLGAVISSVRTRAHRREVRS
jgi:hypothetical protein